MDNFKNLEQLVDQDINPNGSPGSILAANHNNILKILFSMLGKYTGSPFVAKKNITVFTPGLFSWNGNALNKTTDFTVTLSKKTADLNDVGLILETLVLGDLIQFKDYSGRAVFLVYQSHVSGTDGSSNPIYIATVKGLADNPNYIYQDTEQSIAVLSYHKKAIDATPSISTDAGNSAILGTDGKIFVPTSSGGSSSSPVENRFADIATLLANQNIQSDKSIQYVGDASADATVNSGFAYYEYLGTTVGDITDYRKLSEQESMDVIQASGTPPTQNEFADVATLLANQGTQTANFYQFVLDASADPTVASGWAIYQYNGTSVGALTDYTKIMEAESMDKPPEGVSSDANNALINWADGKPFLNTSSLGGGGGTLPNKPDTHVINEFELPFVTGASAIDDNYIYGGSNENFVRWNEKTGQEIIDTITGMDTLRCVFVSRITGFVYFSPDGNFSQTMASIDHGLYKYDGTSVTKVIQLSTFENIWGIDEDTNGNIFAGVYTGGTAQNNNVYKGVNDVFSVVFDPNIGTGNLNRHCHAVHVDRRNNYVYACFGDNSGNVSNVQLNYRSVDGGVNWTAIITSNPAQQMTDVIAVDGHRIFGVDFHPYGAIYISYDDVSTIQVLDIHYSNCFFLKQSDVTGWIYAGFKLEPSANTKEWRADLYVSKDLGLNWILYDTIVTESPNADGYAYASEFHNGVMVIGYLRGYQYQKGIVIRELENGYSDKGVREISVSRELNEFDNNKILSILNYGIQLTVPANKLQSNFQCEFDVVKGDVKLIKKTGATLDVPFGDVLKLNKHGKLYAKKISNHFRLIGDFIIELLPLISLIAEYKFEDNIFDNIENNDGTPTDITYITDGGVNKSALFNGTTSHIVLPASTNTSFNNGSNDIPKSISFLVKMNTVKDVFLVSKEGLTTSNIEYRISYFGGKLRLQLYTPNNTQSMNAIFTVAFNANKWYHIIASYDGSKTLSGLSLFIDGVKKASVNTGNAPFDGTVNNGASTTVGKLVAGGFHLDGKMDCLKFWNTELSSTQALEIATKELNGEDINP